MKRDRAAVGFVLFACLQYLLPTPVHAGTTVPFFSQRDFRWADDYMGSSGGQIKDYGCAMTCTAMLLEHYGKNTDPGQLNAWLSANGGYTPTGLLDWPKPAEHSGGRMQYVSSQSWTSVDIATDNDRWDELKAQLDQGCPVIVEVDGVPATPALEQHWVLVTGFAGGSVHDPSN